MLRYFNPKIGRYYQADPIGLHGGINMYDYAATNPLTYTDPNGLTVRSNWNFFWDWVLERGDELRTYGYSNYGPNTVEMEEMMDSPGANYMRQQFRKNNCQDVTDGGYSTLRAYYETIMAPNSTPFQIGGFIYTAKNNGDGTVTYRVYNQASLYSFFLHIPFMPHKPRGGMFPFGGNINQYFEWIEPTP